MYLWFHGYKWGGVYEVQPHPLSQDIDVRTWFGRLKSPSPRKMICGARTRFFHPHPFRLWLKNCFFTEWPAAFFALNHASLDVNKCHHEHSSRGQIGIPEMPGLKFWFFKIRKRSWNLTKRLHKAPHEYSQQRKASSFLWLFGSKPSIIVILYHMKIHCPVFFWCFPGFWPTAVSLIRWL